MSDSRQQFEKKYPVPEGLHWFEDRNGFFYSEDNLKNSRSLECTIYNAMAEAWQASRACLEVELPAPLDGRFETIYASGYKDGVEDAGIKIKQQGIKVKP